MKINIPELSLVILVGASGSGKSTFAKEHFNEFEVVSSDRCRGIVSNDENDQASTKEAFELLNYIVAKRLKKGLLTVVDATNVQKESRKSLISLAREYHALPVALIFDLPQKVSEERNKVRTDRTFGSHVVRQQKSQLRQSLKGLKREGFRSIHTFKTSEEVDSITDIVRDKLYNDKKDITGPFDIIGDIHGCYDETIELINKLGYTVNQVDDNGTNYGIDIIHPEARKVIFLGDLIDRGPNSPAVLKLVMSMVSSGSALCVPGNHDIKLQKYLNGKSVAIKHGLEETINQLENESDEFKIKVKEFLYTLISHFVLDEGNLVVSHAGLKEDMHGKASGAVRAFCLFGETTGETDEFGLPIRYNWASEYKGRAKVIYGHTPVPKAEWLNRTMNIDTGCVFGGRLTALKYPEDELVSVDAKETYCEPVKPIGESTTQLSNQQEYDDLLNIDDVIGKRIIQTRLRNNITILEDNSIAALEVMSRFAINPKWLVYLPPTMSPSETSDLDNYLEHPAEAISYYGSKGIDRVVCEEKHMGSRVVLVICKDEEATIKKFGIENEGFGICYTRTGRNFFTDEKLELEFITAVRDTLSKSNFWEKFDTDWVTLDAELMPWSAKAQSLLKDQYAAVGSAASNSLGLVNDTLLKSVERGLSGADELLNRFKYKEESVTKFIDSYRNYCWEVSSLDDYKLAPFHILATEGNVHSDKNHQWHMENIAEICKANLNLFRITSYKIIDTTNEDSVAEAINWWTELTSKGGEGMVVKPFDFIAFGKKGLVQPAIKCRGSEYLRIIYGPDYDMSKNLLRLKKRNLSKKRTLAIKEFALGMEGLHRFIEGEALRRVHESVFGVLALESEEVDPRL